MAKATITELSHIIQQLLTFKPSPNQVDKPVSCQFR